MLSAESSGHHGMGGHMGDGFDVSVDGLREHAATVEGVASQVSSVGTAAQISLGGDSFGVIAEFFATAVMSATDQVREAIGTSAQAVMDVGSGLTATANLYQQIEDTHAQVFRVAGGAEEGVATAQVVPGSGRQVGQRDKAIAVLEGISKDHPVSVATVAVRQVRWFRGWAFNVASATIGDHYDKDIRHLLVKEPTDANLREVADTETKYWNSERGNWVGRLVSADTRYDMLVEARTEWLNEMPPDKREEIARQLGIRPGN
jgi:Excreted virulence factor EspC, type VII ESX diderm